MFIFDRKRDPKLASNEAPVKSEEQIRRDKQSSEIATTLLRLDSFKRQLVYARTNNLALYGTVELESYKDPSSVVKGVLSRGSWWVIALHSVLERRGTFSLEHATHSRASLQEMFYTEHWGVRRIQTILKTTQLSWPENVIISPRNPVEQAVIRYLLAFVSNSQQRPGGGTSDNTWQRAILEMTGDASIKVEIDHRFPDLEVGHSPYAYALLNFATTEEFQSHGSKRVSIVSSSYFGRTMKKTAKLCFFTSRNPSPKTETFA